MHPTNNALFFVTKYSVELIGDFRYTGSFMCISLVEKQLSDFIGQFKQVLHVS